MSEGARTFQAGGAAYDRLVGRYSAALAGAFADAAGISAGRALDVGCGPGALTAELAQRLGTDAVTAIDPSEPFVADCRARNPGVDVRQAAAEAIPLDDGAFDATLAQLVLHFVSDATAAAAEMRRVTRADGVVAACVWDFTDGMRALRAFWDAALALDPDAPDEATTMRFGRDGEIAELFRSAGLRDVTSGALDVSAGYRDLDDLWSGFTAGIGPSGAWVGGLDDERRAALRDGIEERIGRPQGPFTLTARAWYATGLR